MFWSLLPAVTLAVILVGFTTVVWGTAGLLRCFARIGATRRAAASPHAIPSRSSVAVLIPAHNEELVLPATLRAATALLDAEQIFVVSDGSSDGTADVARSFGTNVLELNPNRGKAGAISAAIMQFRLAERFEIVMLLDADTVLDEHYFDTGLPLFTGDDVVAVAGTAMSMPHPRPPTLVGKILVGYRQRVYIVVQWLHKYGQAARPANAVWIVPGFASMYRSRVLASIDITARGLTIEDYNMTFELHTKSLGRIAFDPRAARAYTQDPDTVHQYSRQVGRWALGFWQTVMRHKWRPDRFWAGLSLYMVELVFGSLVFVLLLPALIVSAAATFVAAQGIDPTGVSGDVAVHLPLQILVLGALAPDYAFTIITAIVLKRPGFLLLGLAFPAVRLLDAVLCLRGMPEALRSDSDGRWVSPTRRPNLSHLATKTRG